MELLGGHWTVLEQGVYESLHLNGYTHFHLEEESALYPCSYFTKLCNPNLLPAMTARDAVV